MRRPAHQASHDVPLVDRLACEVTISDLRHALHGRPLALALLESPRGRDFVVVALPNGRHRSVRRSQTDLMTPLKESAQPGLAISPSQCPHLVHIDALFAKHVGLTR